MPIVGIGASAGGLEAVSKLLGNLSPDTGMAFIYIQHLDPTHESMLAEILSKTTTMPVTEAQHLVDIEPNHVYVIPPNKDMEIIEGVLTLIARKPKPALHMPIDQFFISLAERQKENAIGVVLSGSASDGTAGLKAIKIAGGITIAQDETARFQSMPRSAIAEGVVDMVLPPDEIAGELKRLSEQSLILKDVIRDGQEGEITDHDENLKSIIQLIKKSIGVDFSHYKMNTIKRRIVRRMLLYKLDTLHNYLQYLKEHTAEVNILHNDLLINVTSFFRDPDSMEFLKKTVLQRILKSKPQNDPIRIWVPACSTGEEAYSLAMVIMEILGDNAAHNTIQIFATDLSEAAISKARLGFYARNEMVNVPAQQLQRFFTKIDGGYRIAKSIRDLCVFAPHNIFKDPPFSRLDLISCCNLLIYLDTVLQKKILATFHYALNAGGYLILGKSESVSSSPQLFTQLEKKYKIYTRKNNAASQAIFEMSKRLSETAPSKIAGTRQVTHKENRTDGLEKAVDDILLNQYIPACVVVNQELEILQFRGSVGLFLEPSPGKASLNLLKMARPGMAFELRNTMRKSIKSGGPVKKSGLEIKHNGNAYQVSIEVVPLKNDTDEPLYLIIFTQTASVAPVHTKSTQSRDQRIRQLEEELSNMREDMHAVIEEQEASNEELQSANEEIVSSNEELQSINEELETSKEEIEASNEELLTINQELQVRNQELAEAYAYSEAVFATIREALLVLDKDLRVVSANKAFYKLFRIREEDAEGRLIYELGHHQWDIPALRELLEKVIPQNSEFQGFKVAHHFTDLGEKVLLLNARKVIQQVNRQQLILLAIEDMTEYHRAQRVVEEREQWFRNMADNAPVMIWISDSKKSRTFFNRTWLEYTGRTLTQELNDGWIAGIHPDDLNNFLRHFSESFDTRVPFQMEYRLRRHDGAYRWVLSIGKPMFSPDGAFDGYVGSCTEVHTQKMLNEELESRVNERTKELLTANNQLAQSNTELEQYAFVASHDLQEPLRKILTFSNLLEKRHSESLTFEAKGYLDRINSAAERMSLLINDLLDFSRLTKQDKAFEKTDLNALVKNVLDDFDMIVSQKKASITVQDLPVIEAIPLQMTQLFHNLLSNALKFAHPDRAPRIIISAHKISVVVAKKHVRDFDPEAEYVDITVQDNGDGFDQQYAEQIFVIFQRLHSKQLHPGTGIGLALCRRIANHHCGEIYAESKPGDGAAFHVILPLRQQRQDGKAV
ncbi:MAG TPA: CheR family methyltransferase [Saprospiraceae bacterium]|nr:CheR family methyltransferase [Saprospiraceae bacterium]